MLKYDMFITAFGQAILELSGFKDEQGNPHKPFLAKVCFDAKTRQITCITKFFYTVVYCLVSKINFPCLSASCTALAYNGESRRIFIGMSNGTISVCRFLSHFKILR